MKRRAVILLLLLAAPAWAATPWSLDVSWTAPTTNDCSAFVATPQQPTCPGPLTDLAGYRLYFSAPCPSQQYAIVPTPTSQPALGDLVGVTVNGLTPSTTYTAQITAADVTGNESGCSPLASGTTLAAAPPQPLSSLSLAFQPTTAHAAVAVDATMTAGNSADGLNQEASAATSISSTGITVGASASLLVVTIVFQSVALGPVSLAVTWNGVAMTARANVTVTGSRDETAYIFTLVSPASGAKTLAGSWTNVLDCYMSAVSFTGTDTTTGVATADNTTATNTTTITVPSTTDGATVATFVTDGGTPTVNFTKIWAESPLNPGGGGTYTLGGTSNAHTFTGAGGTAQALAGVHVIAAAGGGTLFRNQGDLSGLGGGGKFKKSPLEHHIEHEVMVP